MERLSHVVAAMLLVCSCATAQHTTTNTRKTDTRAFADRVWFGGGVGLNFGTVTAIQVEPMAGYFLDQQNKLSVGLGLSYWYYSDNRYIPAITNDGYGYRVFTRYRPIPQVFGHVEFLHLNAQRYILLDNEIRRMWIPHVLIGGGYVQSLSARSSMYFQVLWEVLQDPNSIYLNQGPIISAGVGIGF